MSFLRMLYIEFRILLILFYSPSIVSELYKYSQTMEHEHCALHCVQCSGQLLAVLSKLLVIETKLNETGTLIGKYFRNIWKSLHHVQATNSLF